MHQEKKHIVKYVLDGKILYTTIIYVLYVDLIYSFVIWK